MKTTRVDLELLAFVALAILAVGTPHIAIVLLNTYWAAFLSIVIIALWFRLLPKSCINGSYFCSLIALTILGNAIGTGLLAIVGTMTFLLT